MWQVLNELTELRPENEMNYKPLLADHERFDQCSRRHKCDIELW